MLFCFLPIKKVHPAFFSLKQPSSRKEIKIEINGVQWIYDRNGSGQLNEATKCKIKKTTKNHKVLVELQGKPKGYCEIRKRIHLDFKPNKIECDNKKVKLKYFQKSGLIEIRGQLPENIYKYAKVLLTLSRQEKKKKGRANF